MKEVIFEIPDGYIYWFDADNMCVRTAPNEMIKKCLDKNTTDQEVNELVTIMQMRSPVVHIEYVGRYL